MTLTNNDENGKHITRGKVKVRIDITPIEWADQNKIGSGRNEPNIEPYLPPPIGRFHFTLNPLKLY
jgi:hypothetical protein